MSRQAVVDAGRGSRVAPALSVLSVVMLAAAAVSGHHLKAALTLMLAITVASSVGNALLRWRNLLTAILVVILFVPIRRYSLPVNLPFQMEPYRLLITVVAVGWLVSLLVDPRVRFRRSQLDAPLLLVLLASAGSIAVNSHRISAEGATSLSTKAFTFLLSFAVVFYLILSLVRRRSEIDHLLRVLVGGGCVVALFALVELWSGFNVFTHLGRALPFLKQTQDPLVFERGSHVRVYASAQHPIALGSMLVLLIPIAVYLARSTRQRRWAATVPILGLGVLATVSRTGVLTLLVVGLVYVFLKPRQMARLWPLLVPALAAVHFAVPGLLGTFYQGFFPKGGLIAEQAAGQVGSSRVASLGPGLAQVSLHPVLGTGYGSRILRGPAKNSFIVDDQWLSTAMETGTLGIAAWTWLFVRFLRKVVRAARLDQSERSWLFTALTASSAAFAVGMLTYDAFSFIQVTFVLFILFAVGCAALRASEDEWADATDGPRTSERARGLREALPLQTA